jgi:hypothetical protein
MCAELNAWDPFNEDADLEYSASRKGYRVSVMIPDL